MTAISKVNSSTVPFPSSENSVTSGKQAENASGGDLVQIPLEDRIRDVSKQLESIKTLQSENEKGKAFFELLPRIQLLRAATGANVGSLRKHLSTLLRRCKKIEQRLQKGHSLLLKSLKASLSQMIENDENPEIIQDVQDIVEDFEKFYAINPEFRPLLRDLRRLLATVVHDDDVVKRLILPLLDRTFIRTLEDGGLTSKEAFAFVSQLMFMADNGWLDMINGSYDKVCEILPKKVEELLKEKKQRYEVKLGTFSYTKVFDPNLVRCTILPQAIALAISRPDGTLNIGVIDHVKSVFLQGEGSGDGNIRYIEEKLKELQSNEHLVRSLETIPLPHPDCFDDINGTLFNSCDHQVTEADVRRVCLTALLTFCRQGTRKDCYLESWGGQQQEEASEWLLDDFKELLRTGGSLWKTITTVDTRTVFYTKKYELRGLPWPFQKATIKEFVDDDVYKIFISPNVTNACQSLGCTSLVLFKEAMQIYRTETDTSSYSLYKIFEILSRSHPNPGEAVRRACWIAEAPMQNLLLDRWKNAIGNLLFLPLSEATLITSFYGNIYFKSILSTFLYLATVSGHREIKKRIQTFLAYGREDKLPRYPFPRHMQQLVTCFVPEPLNDENYSFAFFTSEGGGFKPIPDEEALGKFLQKCFLEWMEEAEGQIPQAVKENLDSKLCPPLEIVKKFKEELKRQKGMEVESTTFSTLSYSMTGASNAVVSFDGSSIDTTQYYSHNLSRCSKESIDRFIQWAKEMREQHGTHSHLSFLASTTHHAFRILPNHPSLVNASSHPNTTQRIQDSAQAIVSRPARFIQKNIELISKGLKFYSDQIDSDLIEYGAVWEKGDFYNELVEGIREYFMNKNIEKCSMRQFLPIAWEIFQKLRNKYDLRRPLQQYKEAFYFITTKEIFPDYKNGLLYFADSNYQSFIEGCGYNEYYCFLFNPINRKWAVVRALETGDISNVEQSRNKFISSLLLQTTIAPIARMGQERELMSVVRKTLKKSSLIQRKFATAWSVLTKELGTLSDKDRRDALGVILENPSHPHASKPLEPLKKWKAAFAQCISLRKTYTDLLQEYSQMAPSEAYQYKVTQRLGGENPTIALLTGSESGFRRKCRRYISNPKLPPISAHSITE